MAELIAHEVEVRVACMSATKQALICCRPQLLPTEAGQKSRVTGEDVQGRGGGGAGVVQGGFNSDTPPRVRVMRRIILCRAMPLSTTALGVSRDMASYMSLSISQKAMVLSPTSAYANIVVVATNTMLVSANTCQQTHEGQRSKHTIWSSDLCIAQHVLSAFLS